jgi:hypothetical protein
VNEPILNVETNKIRGQLTALCMHILNKKGNQAMMHSTERLVELATKEIDRLHRAACTDDEAHQLLDIRNPLPYNNPDEQQPQPASEADEAET